MDSKLLVIFLLSLFCFTCNDGQTWEEKRDKQIESVYQDFETCLEKNKFRKAEVLQLYRQCRIPKTHNHGRQLECILFITEIYCKDKIGAREDVKRTTISAYGAAAKD